MWGKVSDPREHNERSTKESLEWFERTGDGFGLAAALLLFPREHVHPTGKSDRTNGPRNPGGLIELLRGDRAKTVHVQGATLSSRPAMGPARPFRKDEIDTLLKIIGQMTEAERPEDGVEVRLAPFVDRLTFFVDDSGRKVSIVIDISERHDSMNDRSTHRTYVVPEQSIKALTALLAAGNEQKPHP